MKKLTSFPLLFLISFYFLFISFTLLPHDKGSFFVRGRITGWGKSFLCRDDWIREGYNFFSVFFRCWYSLNEWVYRIDNNKRQRLKDDDDEMSLLQRTQSTCSLILCRIRSSTRSGMKITSVISVEKMIQRWQGWGLFFTRKPLST